MIPELLVAIWFVIVCVALLRQWREATLAERPARATVQARLRVPRSLVRRRWDA